MTWDHRGDKPFRRAAIQRVIAPEQATALVGKSVPAFVPTDLDAVVLHDVETSQPVVAYLPLDRTLVAELRRQLVGFQCSTVSRNADYQTRSTTFGHGPRAAINQREGCSATAFSRDHVQKTAALEAMARHLQELLLDIDPAIVDRDRRALSAIKPDWFIGDTDLWTSGVINQTSTLPYHRDSFNFPTWSAMPVLRRGISGGHLHIPEYDLLIPCRDGWGVFFPGHDLVHGVTPMTATATDGYRYSVVYYALKGMKDCFTAAEETAYARRKRTEREIAMAARITATQEGP